MILEELRGIELVELRGLILMFFVAIVVFLLSRKKTEKKESMFLGYLGLMGLGVGLLSGFGLMMVLLANLPGMLGMCVAILLTGFAAMGLRNWSEEQKKQEEEKQQEESGEE